MPRGYDTGHQRHPFQNYKSYVLNRNCIYRQTIPQIRFHSTGFVVLSHHINYLPTNISWAPIMFQICECVLSHFSCVWLSVTLWTVVCQTPLSMGFSRQAYWSELPCPPLGDLPNPEIEPRSPALQVGSLPSQPPGKPKNTGVGGLSLLQESRNQTQESNLVSCIAGGFFTNWATKEALIYTHHYIINR